MGQSNGGRISVDGRSLRNFSSNDYLGLARHPALIRQAQAFAAEWGAGARASRLVCGNLAPYEVIEAKLARTKRTDAALVLPSGFQANASVLPALLDERVLGAPPLVFSDALNHASIRHGCAAARVRPLIFRHADLGHLEELLLGQAGRPGPRFVLSETLFSMDGDQADVPALVAIAERHGAFLYLDESHATGVLGPQGAGLGAPYADRTGLMMGTFGKALGSAGAFVAGSSLLCDYLVNRCRGLVYSTALPPATLGAIDAALDLVPSLDEERQALQRSAADLRRALNAAGLDTGPSSSQIIPVMLGSERAALEVSRGLEAEGMLGVAIRPPTVLPGSSRIRLSITVDHAPDDLAAVAEALPRLAAGHRREQPC